MALPLSAHVLGSVPTPEAAREHAETAAAAVNASKGAPTSARRSSARSASCGLPHRPKAEIKLFPARVR